MLADAKLPISFWAEAVDTACHVLNRVLIVKGKNKTPYELLKGRAPRLDYLYPFGNPVSLLLQAKDRKTKFDAKAQEGIFLGYVDNSPCRRVWNTENGRIEEWYEVECHKQFKPKKPVGPAWGFDYDSLWKSFNLPEIPVELVEAVVDQIIGEDQLFTTRSVVPIDAPATTASTEATVTTAASDVVQPNNVQNEESEEEEEEEEEEEAPEEQENAPIFDPHYDTSDESEAGDISTNLENLNLNNNPDIIVHRNHPIENVIGNLQAGVQTRN